MEAVIISVFVFGYLAITLEHSLKIDKLIPALVMMAVSWALISFGIDDFTTWFDSGKHALLSNFEVFDHTEKMHILEETLLHHLGKTAEILVFLIGAMTIVEIIAYFNGFSTIKNFIKTKKKSKLLWIFAVLAFVLSAIIDNLTATIVLISILQKIVNQRRSNLVCRFNYYCSKCGWCFFSYWRCNDYDALDWRQGKYWDVIYVFIYPITFVYGGSYIYCDIFTRI